MFFRGFRTTLTEGTGSAPGTISPTATAGYQTRGPDPAKTKRPRVHTRTGRVAYSFDAHGEPVNPLPPAIVVSPACGTLVNTAPTAAVPSAYYSIPAPSAAPPVPGYDSSSVAMAPYWQHQTNYYGRSGVAAPAYYSYWPLPDQHETTWVWKY